MSTIETGQPPLFAQEVPPVAITEVSHARDMGRSVREILSVVVFILLLMLGFALTVAYSRRGPSFLFPIAVALSIFVCFLLYRWYRRRCLERLQIVRYDALSASITALLPRIRGSGADAGLKRIVQQLASQGKADSTVRIGRVTDAAPVQPLAFQFEPQPLNEATCDLIVASAAGGREIDADALARATGGADAARLKRLVRRNVLLRGGWVLIAIFSFNTLMAGIEAIVRRQLTARLGLWFAAVLVVLFVPARRTWFRSVEFLVVPGGLIRRKSGWRQSGWKLHVFDRRRSALIVARMHRQRWGAYVSDGQESDSFIGTKREMDFLLRAWMSPLPPPPVELLSDLA